MIPKVRSRRLGVEPSCLSCLGEEMEASSEFLSHEAIKKLEKSALLMEPLLDAQLSFEIDDLTPHQNEYWSWWALQEQTSISRNYEEREKPDPIHEIAESFSHACKRELEIIRTISDSALELRRTRLASERKRTAA